MVRATSQSYFGNLLALPWVDNDFDSTETYTISANWAIGGILCSHNSPALEIYDGADWRAVELATGDNIRVITNSVMCAFPLLVSAGGTATGSVRIGSPAVDDTKLNVMMFELQAEAT